MALILLSRCVFFSSTWKEDIIHVVTRSTMQTPPLLGFHYTPEKPETEAGSGRQDGFPELGNDLMTDLLHHETHNFAFSQCQPFLFCVSLMLQHFLTMGLGSEGYVSLHSAQPSKAVKNSHEHVRELCSALSRSIQTRPSESSSSVGGYWRGRPTCSFRGGGVYRPRLWQGPTPGPARTH